MGRAGVALEGTVPPTGDCADRDRRGPTTSVPLVPGLRPDPLAAVADLPGVPDAVERARAAVDGLRGHRVLRRSAAKVAGESALRGARASAALEGASVPLDAVRRAVRAPADGATSTATGEEASSARDPVLDDAVLQGALRAAAELGALTQTWRHAPLQALARLHALAAVGLVPPEELGRPRTDPAVSARLGALAALLTSPTRVPALVVAAVVHGELLTIEAFAPADGVVARAAERLTLVDRGLDPGGLSCPEVGHAELGREAYLAGARRYAEGGARGVAGWVAQCADAVVLGAREGVAVCEAIQRGA